MLFGFAREELQQRISDHGELGALASCREIAVMHQSIAQHYHDQLARMLHLNLR